MKAILFFGFIATICKGSILIAIGAILFSHFETLVSMIMRKPIPQELIPSEKYNAAIQIIRIVGVAIMILGIIMIISGIVGYIYGMKMPAPNFNFKF